MRLFLLLLLFFSFSARLFAQSGTVQGFVVDKDSKLRLAKVYIYNSHTNEGIYNTPKGEFRINGLPGDTLFAILQGYAVDTVVLKSPSSIYFQLKSLGINLQEVSINGKKLSPKEQYDKRLKEYKYQLDKGSSKDLLNLGPGGVGLGIDAIYNLVSREGKNARHLQKILERDYKESIIDFRFNPNYVKSILQLNDSVATDFMEQYRPSYDFVLSASDYAFVVFLRNSYASYKRNPSAFRLQPLPKVIVKEF
ncbi:peptidase associated/transthyretin-like domain-containing protein [Pedobacter sp. PWIIR3]